MLQKPEWDLQYFTDIFSVQKLIKFQQDPQNDWNAPSPTTTEK